jgi:hypothetical protein
VGNILGEGSSLDAIRFPITFRVIERTQLNEGRDRVQV